MKTLSFYYDIGIRKYVSARINVQSPSAYLAMLFNFFSISLPQVDNIIKYNFFS